ncbi:MAG: UDP-3-O-acyl-N-acetylglucosamine deacetylase [Lentisphaerota bacterium]
MSDDRAGKILAGDPDVVSRAYDRLEKQPIDWDIPNGDAPVVQRPQRTIERPVTIQGPGTFFGKSTRTVTLEPTELEGWWFDRVDLPDTLPVRVSIRNVWTTGLVVSNIVLRSGSPHNYIRMVEHIIALKMGMAVDNLMIRIDSGDPPLFTRGSLDLVEAMESAGIREVDRPAQYVMVKEKVTVASPNGSFLTIAPCAPACPSLKLDCAVDFKTAIRKQRIRFTLNKEHFKQGSEARTNTSAIKMFYCMTVGKLFADVRNLGYSMENILVAGKFCYYNKPRLFHEGKSLEAAWHRATLDLLAAIALIDDGQFVGEITSFKAGHALDVEMVRLLYKNRLLKRL